MFNKDFTKMDRLIGKSTALALFYLGIIYTVVLIIGMVSLKSQLEPIHDPWFSIMEMIILIMAPLMVVLMVEVHAYASHNVKTLSLTALIFMGMLACITCSVHFTVLTIIHSFNWPSVVYAVDILAWDLFFSLSMLFAAPVFKGDRLNATVRILMIVCGVLSLIGLIGPIIGNMQIRYIGIVGYAVFFPVICLLLAKVFSKTGSLYEEDMQSGKIMT